MHDLPATHTKYHATMKARNVYKELADMADAEKARKYPSIPSYAIPHSRYLGKDTNSLTRAVIDFINLSGGYAVRIQSQGQYDPKRGIWRKGQTRKGTADIIACIDEKFVSIEIKTGRDKQSPEQKRTQDDVDRAGGQYWIIRDFDIFLKEIKKFTDNN